MAPRKKKVAEPRPPTPNARGEYRPIYSVLQDSDEFKVLSKDGKLLWYGLKLTLGASGIGVLFDDQIAERSGINLNELQPARRELVSGGWIEVEGRTHWLRNGLMFEPNLSLANANHRASVERYLRGLPKLSIVNRFASYYDLALPFPDLVASDPPGHGISMGSEGDLDGISMGSPGDENADVDNRLRAAKSADPRVDEEEKPSNHTGVLWDLDGISMGSRSPSPSPSPKGNPKGQLQHPPLPPTPPSEVNGGGDADATTDDEVHRWLPTARANIALIHGGTEADVEINGHRVGMGIDVERYLRLAEKLPEGAEVVARAIAHLPGVTTLAPPISLARWIEADDGHEVLAQCLHRAAEEAPRGPAPIRADVKSVPHGTSPAGEEAERIRQKRAIAARTQEEQGPPKEATT